MAVPIQVKSAFSSLQKIVVWNATTFTGDYLRHLADDGALLSYIWFQTTETGGQWYSDTSPFSIPWWNQLVLDRVFLNISRYLSRFIYAPYKTN
jgi:hypothetical protein